MNNNIFIRVCKLILQIFKVAGSALMRLTDKFEDSLVIVGVSCLIIGLLISYMTNLSLDLPEKHVSSTTQQCVKYVYQGKDYACDGQFDDTTKYSFVWVK